MVEIHFQSNLVTRDISHTSEMNLSLENCRSLFNWARKVFKTAKQQEVWHVTCDGRHYKTLSYAVALTNPPFFSICKVELSKDQVLYMFWHRQFIPHGFAPDSGLAHDLLMSGSPGDPSISSITRSTTTLCPINALRDR